MAQSWGLAMKWLISVAITSLAVSIAGAFPSLPATESVKSRLQVAIRTLSNDSGEDHLKAVQEIQSLGPWGRPAIPVMSKLLLESSPQIASEVAVTIARLGSAGREARATLLEVIGRPQLDTYLLSACARAIAAIGDAGN